MANQFYDRGLDKFCTGDIDWINDPIYSSLIYLSEYTPDLQNHEFLSSVPDDAIASSVLITGKVTNLAGTMDGDDVTYPSVPGDGSKPAAAVILWKQAPNGNKLISPLIALITDGDEFPFYPDGSDISTQWSNGGNKILSLRDNS